MIFEHHLYTPAQQSCKGDILESAFPSGRPAPIDFEVTGSKVKVTGALTKKACPPNN
jgi:hypothetical protein